MLARIGAYIVAETRRLAERALGAQRPFKQLFVAGADCFSCVIAAWLAFSLRLGYWQLATQPVLLLILFELVTFLAVFTVTGAYRNVFRFHGARGLAQLAIACFLIALPTVAVFGLLSVPGVPRTISVLFPLIFFALVATSRIVARYVLLELIGTHVDRQRVLIYGAGQAGRQLASSLAHEPTYRLVGYVDDDLQLAGQRIEAVPVSISDELEVLIKEKHIDIVLLAVPEIGRAERASLVRRLQSAGVRVQTLPAVRQIVDGKVSISDLREIDVADLLSRDAVAPDPNLLGRSINGRTVLVTGAGGSIGSELCRQILRQRPERLIMFEMTEAVLFAIDNELRSLAGELGVEVDLVPELGSLVNQATTQRLFERWRPQTVFHAAAYKHVPLVQKNAVSGIRNNVLGTMHAAQAALASGVERFVLVSTDKAVRPTNVMGASKRVCELVLQALADEPGETVFSMVRFGNVLGSSGSVVPQFERQIADGGPVTVTHRDVTRFFMTIPEAAELVIQAGAMAHGGEVYLLDMGAPVRIYELARSMIQLAGLTVRDESNPDGDISIVEVGLRPGEKLFEELLISAEARPTDHPRIMMADEDKLAWAEVDQALKTLRSMLDGGDSDGARKLLHELVPGFVDTGSAGQEAAELDDQIVTRPSSGPAGRGVASILPAR